MKKRPDVVGIEIYDEKTAKKLIAAIPLYLMLAEVNRFFVNPKLTSLGIWHCDILPKSTFLMREILTLPTCSDSVPTFTRQSTPPGDMDPEAPSEPDPEVLPRHGP